MAIVSEGDGVRWRRSSLLFFRQRRRWRAVMLLFHCVGWRRWLNVASMATAFVRRLATALCASAGDGFRASAGDGFVCVGWRRLSCVGWRRLCVRRMVTALCASAGDGVRGVGWRRLSVRRMATALACVGWHVWRWRFSGAGALVTGGTLARTRRGAGVVVGVTTSGGN